MYPFTLQRLTEHLLHAGLGIQRWTSQSLCPHSAAALGGRAGHITINTSWIRVLCQEEKYFKSWIEDRTRSDGSVRFYREASASRKTFLGDKEQSSWRRGALQRPGEGHSGPGTAGEALRLQWAGWTQGTISEPGAQQIKGLWVRGLETTW